MSLAPHKIILAILFGSFALAVFIGMWSSSIAIYSLNTTIDAAGANFTKSYNKINETYDLVNDIKNQSESAEVGTGEGIIDTIFGGGFKAVRLVTGSYEVVGTVLNDIAMELGIPAFIIKFFMTVIMILITFGIIYLVLGRTY